MIAIDAQYRTCGANFETAPGEVNQCPACGASTRPRPVDVPSVLPSEMIRQGWSPSSVAIDKDGNSVGAAHREAVAWCFVGAAVCTLNYASTQFLISIKQYMEEVGIAEGLDFFNGYCLSQEEAVAIAEEVERRLGWRRPLTHTAAQVGDES